MTHIRLATIALLTCSNVFMTFAWLGAVYFMFRS